MIEKLTPRETEMLKWLHLDKRSDIALKLGVAHTTINTHISNIYSKLHVTHRTQAVVKALKLGIITLEELEID
jgi:NarL family two-component system response regulator LiaR